MPYAQLSADIPFVFGEVQTSKRGQKFAPITVNGSNPLYQLTDFDHALYAPFGCGVYQEKGDETRLNLDFQLPDGGLISWPCWTATFAPCKNSSREQLEAPTTPWSHEMKGETTPQSSE